MQAEGQLSPEVLPKSWLSPFSWQGPELCRNACAGDP